MKRYRLTPQAKSDSTSIADYLRSAPREGRQRVLRDITTGLEQTCDFPESGQLEREHFVDQATTVRSILVAPYRIFHLPETSPVAIFTMHGARNIADILRERQT